MTAISNVTTSPNTMFGPATCVNGALSFHVDSAVRTTSLTLASLVLGIARQQFGKLHRSNYQMVSGID
jgi:hypothetical protein